MRPAVSALRLHSRQKPGSNPVARLPEPLALTRPRPRARGSGPPSAAVLRRRDLRVGREVVEPARRCAPFRLRTRHQDDARCTSVEIELPTRRGCDAPSRSSRRCGVRTLVGTPLGIASAKPRAGPQQVRIDLGGDAERHPAGRTGAFAASATLAGPPSASASRGRHRARVLRWRSLDWLPRPRGVTVSTRGFQPRSAGSTPAGAICVTTTRLPGRAARDQLGPLTLQTFGICFALAFIAAGALIWQPLRRARQARRLGLRDGLRRAARRPDRLAARLHHRELRRGLGRPARQHLLRLGTGLVRRR